MLVLTRRQKERVLFPTLGISVEVIKVGGNKARLGIVAPPEIPVLRHELTERKPTELSPEGSESRQQLGDLTQLVRRRLDRATAALNNLHAKLDESQEENTQEIVQRLYRDLDSLERKANELIEWSDTARTTQILVVEDSVVERKLMAGLLELSGLNVITAGDGLEALEFLSMHAKPDAVLLDMMMPRCDGPEFVHKVRSQPGYEDLKIFAMSAVEPISLGLATGRDGINGWFPKPLDPIELLSSLDRRLHESLAV